MERTIIRHIYFIKENILIKCSRKDIAWFPRSSQRDPLEETHVYIYVLNIYVCMYTCNIQIYYLGKHILISAIGNVYFPFSNFLQ